MTRNDFSMSFRSFVSKSNRTKGEAGMRSLLRNWRLALMIALMMAASAQGGNAMELKSSAFADGEKIPQKYVMPGAGGKNLSLPFQWSGAPAGTQSFALAIVDPHPVAHNWVHWPGDKPPGGTQRPRE